MLSTAAEKAVACAPFTHRARVRSPVGTSFPEYHLSVIIILLIPPC